MPLAEASSVLRRRGRRSWRRLADERVTEAAVAGVDASRCRASSRARSRSRTCRWRRCAPLSRRSRTACASRRPCRGSSAGRRSPAWSVPTSSGGRPRGELPARVQTWTRCRAALRPGLEPAHRQVPLPGLQGPVPPVGRPAPGDEERRRRAVAAAVAVLEREPVARFARRSQPPGVDDSELLLAGRQGIVCCGSPDRAPDEDVNGVGRRWSWRSSTECDPARCPPSASGPHVQVAEDGAAAGALGQGQRSAKARQAAIPMFFISVIP